MRYVYAVLGGIAIVVGMTAWWMLDTVNHAASTSTATTMMTIASGEQLRAVATRLENQHLIKSAGAWTLYAITTGQRSAILAGEYRLTGNMTGREILHTLTTNPLKDDEVKVTIQEGWTLKEIAAALEKNGVVNAQEFLNVAQHPSSSGLDLTSYRIASQKPASVDLEGYLFPDTYRFFKHADVKTIIGKMVSTLDARYSAALVDETRASGHSVHEVLTMASILEKELTTTSDRANGSDVFWKRIAAGIPLQSNVTIMYAMGLNEDRLSIADTKFESPYNTYKYKGLPPGPINSPSLVSIQAAIHPTSNQYYYFLADPKTGITYFAKTLDEHNANKQKYLK